MKTNEFKKFSFYVQKYFKDYMAKQKGCSKNTISSYSTTFTLFIEFLGSKAVENMVITSFSKQLVFDFISWLKDKRRNSDKTCNTRIAHFKSFAHFLMMEEPMVMDECSKIIAIPFKKTEKLPPESISEEAITALLAIPGTATREGLRHTAILTLLYDSACRVDELIGLNVSDFTDSTDYASIHVRGKGRKERDIPILPRTRKLIQVYIKRFRLYNPDDILFESKNKGRMTRQGVNYIIKMYADKVKAEDPGLIPSSLSIHPHILRHSKATHLVNNGAGIFYVRDFLGHEGVQKTQTYLTSNPEVTRKAIEKAADSIGIPNTGSYSRKEEAELEEFLATLKL